MTTETKALLVYLTVIGVAATLLGLELSDFMNRSLTMHLQE